MRDLIHFETKQIGVVLRENRVEAGDNARKLRTENESWGACAPGLPNVDAHNLAMLAFSLCLSRELIKYSFLSN